MPKLILKCACEIDGVEHKPGDKIEVDIVKSNLTNSVV